MNYPLDYLIGLPPMASVLIKITLILLLAWGLHFATRRSNPRWRVLLWRGVMIAIPLVFLLNPIAYLEIALAPQEQSLGSVQTSPPAAERIPTAVNEHSIDSTTADSEPVLVSDVPSLPPSALIKNNPFSALFLVWATIFLVLVGRMILGRIQIRKLIATSIEAPKEVRLVLDRVCSELGCTRKIDLRTSPELASPFLVGSSSPAIVIPDRMLEASQTADLPSVFAHEVAHLRSADSFWVGLSGWMNAMLWFHPLVWRISSAHQLACEKTCDGVAANYVEDEKSYSAVLARVALLVHTPAANAAFLPMARSAEVVKRLEALSGRLYCLPMRGRVLAVNGFLFAAAVFLLSGLRVVRSQDQQPEALALSTRSIFHDEPDHLWNRLHFALFARVGPNAEVFGVDELDPLLWNMTIRHLQTGESHQQALSVLDEFLSSRGERLFADPLKRAIMQRDLWAVFDWTTTVRPMNYIYHEEELRALQVRLARILRRLALSGEEIDALPNNYAAAAASGTYSGDPARGEPYLPPELLQFEGPWVELSAMGGERVAPQHVTSVLGRSLFRIFFKLPEGRRATQEYHRKLLESTQELLPSDRELPQFPKGTDVALVRQMMLIDDEGHLTPTEITESVQIRSFVTVDDLSGLKDPLVFEWKLSRPALFGGENGGLRPTGPDEKVFSQFRTMGFDYLEGGSDGWRDTRVIQLRNCRECHAVFSPGSRFDLQGPGIHSLISLKQILPSAPFRAGSFQNIENALEERPGAEAWATQAFKKRQYSWGLLQGLMANEP